MKLFSTLALLLLTSCATALRHEAEIKVMGHEAVDEEVDKVLEAPRIKGQKLKDQQEDQQKPAKS